MPAADEIFWKIVSSNIQKQRKVTRRKRFFWNMVIFSSPGECISFMRVQPHPLEKVGGLTWKGAPLISKFSKPPSTFETPKV